MHRCSLTLRTTAFGFVALLLPIALAGTCKGATVPTGFDDRPVASVVRPTAMALTPDRRLLIASALGIVLSYENGALSSRTVLNISSRICANSERGVLGIAVDPTFTANGFVYLYYTHNKFGECGSMTERAPVNRVSRFVMRSDGTLDPGTEEVLIDNIPSPDGRHNGGDLHFGPDDLLYVSVGDGTCDYAGDSGCQELNDASRDPNVLLGKILRIERDGSIPPSNPFQGEGTTRCARIGIAPIGIRCRETWASGLRNPFRMAFDPDSSEPLLYINDVGNYLWEEIDLGAVGADYGWNVREGPCETNSLVACALPPPGMTNPIHSYDHRSGCTAITGAAFVPDGVWPQEFDQDYLYGDFTCGKVFRMTPLAGGEFESTELASGLGDNALIGMTFGPDLGHGGGPSLYYLVWGDTHGVRRISHNANRAPVARVDASPASGAAPLSVSFKSDGSHDPDGGPIAYEWRFGDGHFSWATGSVAHTYEAGTYTAELTVHDGEGGQDTATVRIDSGNTAPMPAIEVSTAGAGFAVGEPVLLRGSALDPEDGELPGEQLTWTVDRIHENHSHPLVPPTTGDDITTVGPEPEGFGATQTSHLVASLTATDSRGLASTVTKRIDPHLVRLRFNSSPFGARLDLAGHEVTTPADVTSWEGWSFPVSASDQRDANDDALTFTSWSDGGAREHQVTTPSASRIYLARFTRVYVRPKAATPFVASLVPAMRMCRAPTGIHGPPLEHQSCSPPQPQSGYLTVGTDDVNGHDSMAIGEVRLSVTVGSPRTPEDEADVQLRAGLTDVRRIRSGVDYAGELTLDLDVKLTDRVSAVGTTLEPVRIRSTIPCAATAEPEGARCQLLTTLDAVMPGLIMEGRRSVWELGRVRVFDGGSDGIASTEPNTLFQSQGLSIP